MKVTLKALTQSITQPMSIEEYLIHEARVTSPDNRLNHETAPGLLKYLIKSKHWSPFETVSANFEIETSRAIGTQILRHRSFSFQEYSQRYAEVKEIEPVEMRYQASKNRQSSTSIVEDDRLLRVIKMHMKDCKDVYDHLIDEGVAKECARFVLPLAAQTTIVMSGSLRSWIHFLEQRCDDHAQKEIQIIANEIKVQLSGVFPWTAEALEWN